MRDILTLVTAPANEPISIVEAKAHLRVEIDNDDVLIDSYIVAARQHVEQVHGRALITQTWRLTLQAWPTRGYILLPTPPLQSVTSVVYTDEDGADTTWNAANYIVSTDRCRLVLAKDVSWPTTPLYASDPIAIKYVVGFGAAAGTVPTHLRQAIMLIVGHWYENREAVVVTGAVPKQVPLAIDSLLLTNRAY